MIYHNYKVGDKIILLEDCGEQKRGSILTVQVTKEGTTLFVKKDDLPEGFSPGLCSCYSKWKLVESRIITDWEMELKNEIY